MNKNRHIKRRRDIVKAIRLTWASLETHLPDAHRNSKDYKIIGGRKFQADCVREYAFIIKVLADNL